MIEAPSLSVSEIIEREIDAGQAFGPFHRQWLLERAPEKVRRQLELARLFPDIMNSRQGFASMDVNDFPPASFTAVANTTAETNLWTPAIWTPIPANDMRAGKVYKVQYGGIISNTGTPTLIFTPRCGQSATPSSNVSLGVSPTITTTTGLSNHALYGEFILGIRTLGIAAAGATGTGNGFVCFGNASAPASTVAMGAAIPTTLDNTVATGLIVSITWGAASASNTLTCQWATIRSYN
jgi:hypothetical protein